MRLAPLVLPAVFLLAASSAKAQGRVAEPMPRTGSPTPKVSVTPLSMTTPIGHISTLQVLPSGAPATIALPVQSGVTPGAAAVSPSLPLDAATLATPLSTTKAAAIPPPSAASMSGAPTTNTSAAPPHAGAALKGAAVSVRRDPESLRRMYDAENIFPSLTSTVSGQEKTALTMAATMVRQADREARRAPANAPALYEAAIQYAQKNMSKEYAEKKIVHDIRAHFVLQENKTKDTSAPTSNGKVNLAEPLGRLMDQTLDAAAKAHEDGRKNEAVRLLNAFGGWQSLVGAPGRPLISNLEAFRNEVGQLIENSSRKGAQAVPRRWLEFHDGAYVIMSGERPRENVVAVAVTFVKSLALQISPTLGYQFSSPLVDQDEAYRDFAAASGPTSRALAFYQASRKFHVAVPRGVYLASYFWLRSMWEALFHGLKPYENMVQANRDAVNLAAVRSSVADARRALAARPSTTASLNAAFAAMDQAVARLKEIAGNNDAAVAIALLKMSVSPEDPDRLAPWATRLEAEADRIVAARFEKTATGELRAGSVVWSRGRGPAGEVHLWADLRPTTSGGVVKISLERSDAELGAQLASLGFNVTEGRGMTATLGMENFLGDAQELKSRSAEAFAVAQGQASPVTFDAAALQAIAAGFDEARAARFAHDLQSADFSHSRLVGRVGSSFEARRLANEILVLFALGRPVYAFPAGFRAR